MAMNAVVYVGGTFDLFHQGHIYFLRELRDELQRNHFAVAVIASVNTDEFCQRFKRKPVQTLDERMAIVKACRYVNDVCVNDGDEDSTVAIKREFAWYPPSAWDRYIGHGDDMVGDVLYKQMGFDEAFLQENSIRLLIARNTKIFSTTELIQRIHGKQPV